MASFSTTLLLWTAGVIVISRPATVMVPPMPMPMTFCRPFRSSHSDSSWIATIGALVARATVDDVAGVVGVPVRQQDHVGLVDLLRRAGTSGSLEPRVGDDPLAARRGDDEGGVPEPRDREGRCFMGRV